MYCKQCGAILQANQELCDKCVKLHTKQISMIGTQLSCSTPYEQMQQRQSKKRRKILLWVIILGFFCPLIWIGYAVYLLFPMILKSEKLFRDETPTSTSYSGSSTTDSPQKSSAFTFIDGAGNYCQSGGVFIDWAGNLCEWGTRFTDSRGNLIEWGQPFYDGRDNYCTWGSPFYDSRGNYIVP